MDLYKKNLHAKINGYAKVVEPIQDPKLSGVRIEKFLGPTGSLAATIESAKGFVLMHSMYDPLAEASRRVEILDFKKHSLIFVFGLGMAYHLNEIQKYLSPMSQVWVIETDLEVIENAMQSVDLSQLFMDHRFTFCFCLSDYQIIQYFRNTIAESSNFFLSSNPQYIRLNYFEQRNPGLSNGVIRSVVEKLLGVWNSLGNSTEDTIIGLAQNFYNIDVAINNPGINQLANSYKNKPAILVAAGPSLDKNIEMLKQAQGKALIIACDVVVGKLLKHGIRPDAMVSLERILVYEHCLKDRDWEIPEDLVLAAPILIEPVVFKEFAQNKKLVCFKEGETINTWLNEVLEDKGTIYMGNSVAHMAFGLALKLGANPIVFTGQDLAFGDDGMTTHTVDLKEDVSKLAGMYTQEGQCLYLDGYYGGKVKSTMMWKTFKIGFENVIERLNKNFEFIDATEGGAKIEGTVTMPLRDVIEKYCTYPVARLNDLVPCLSDIDRQYYYDRLLESAENKARIFERIKKRAEEQRKVLAKISEKHQDSYLEMDEAANRSICATLVETDEIFKMLKDDLLTVLFFQGLMSVFAMDVIKLGHDLTNENVWRNLETQEQFLDLITDSCIATLATFNNLIRFIMDLKDNNPRAKNFDNYLKIIVTQRTECEENPVGVKVKQELKN